MAARFIWPILGLVVLAFLIAFPFWGSEYFLHVGILLLIWVIVSVSWNLAALSGQVSFAHPGLFGLTAYAASLVVLLFGLNHAMGYVAAVVAGGVLGLGLGAVLLRLKEIYFIIGTLAFSAAIPVIFVRISRMLQESGFEIPGSASVTQGIYPPMLLDGTRKWVFLVVLGLAVISWLALLYFRRKRSLFLALRSIQEDEVAASVCGVNVTFYKLVAFGASSAMLGLAGATYAFYQSIVMPGPAFGFDWGLIAVVMNVVGGVETLAGPLIGTVVLFGLTEVVRIWFGDINLLVYGLLLVVIILTMPQGLMGLAKPIGRYVARVRKTRSSQNKQVENLDGLIHYRR